jgi:predicted Zn-dependent protease/predicted negative regulator of RcsB-dependent stress response
VKLLVDWRARVKHTEPEALGFSTWSGKPISPNNVSLRWIYSACETLGRKRVNWLTLRRAGDTTPEVFLVGGIDTLNASLVDTSLFGHSYYGSNAPSFRTFTTCCHETCRPMSASASRTRRATSEIALDDGKSGGTQLDPKKPRARMWRIIAVVGTIIATVAVAILILSYFYLRDERAFAEISEAFYAGDDDVVIQKVDRLLQGNPISSENVSLLFWKAEAEYRSGQTNAALTTYADGLAKMQSVTNNVTQRGFAGTYLRFAELLSEKGRLDEAVSAVETGLRLNPQSIEGQILLGHLFEQSGQHSRAVAHYQAQLGSALPIAEERAVLTMKVARLSNSRPLLPTPSADLASTPFYWGLSIGLVPINQMPAAVAFDDVCVILEASWRVRCEVLPTLDVSDEGVWDSRRNQYNADVLLTEIERQLPPAARRHTHIVAVTERDIFGPQTGFVFSWQQIDPQHAVAVLSTSRLATEIPGYYEPETIATRRIAIQALSTTGRMFGFERPTNAECPLAYPESLREFQFKRLRLCTEEEEQRDLLLRRWGGAASPMGKARATVISRVSQKYFIE